MEEKEVDKVHTQEQFWQVSICGVDKLVPGMFNPLLAYPREVLDPAVDSLLEEGEARLALLRPVLHMANKATAGLSAPSGAPSLTARLVERPCQQQSVHDSIFKSSAEWKPRIRVSAISTMTCAAAVADGSFDEHTRVTLIPVSNSSNICALNYPRNRLPPPKVLLTFPRRHVGSADAHVTLTRTGTDGFKAVIFSGSGKRSEISATGIAPVLLQRLFEPVAPSVDKVSMIPTLPGQLPVEIASAFADFWQRQKR